ncbi:MAG TPA: AgmX/PglI C-terminal domain-containing protein [Polyangiales bacterium]
MQSPLRAEPVGAPTSVPVALGTHDPNSGRPSFSVITSPAKRPQLTAAVSDDAQANVKVSGLTGTLTRDDVHQTMEARQGDFDACILESRRTLRWVSGAIHFAFKVDGEGRIAEVHPSNSTIGHRDLERCLTMVVATTQFPAPAGRASAEFSWSLHVDPSGAKPPEEASAKPLMRVIHKESRELFKTCEIKRRRTRFRITAYFAPSGHVLSAGAVPLPASADDKVDCVLEQFEKWHLPKLKHASKISFDLR